MGLLLGRGLGAVSAAAETDEGDQLNRTRSRAMTATACDVQLTMGKVQLTSVYGGAFEQLTSVK